MRATKKVILISLASILALISLFYGARLAIGYIFRTKIASAIENLRKQGTDIVYDSLYLNSWNLIRVQGLTINQHSITSPGASAFINVHVSEAKLEGLEILSLLFNKTISFNSIRLENPEIQCTEDVNVKAKDKKRGKIQGINIQKLIINNGKIEIVDSVSCNTLKKLSLTVELSNIQVNDINSAFPSWSLAEMTANTIQVELPQNFYTCTIKKIIYQSRKKIFSVDSLKLTPLYDKSTFVLKTGHQTDRVVCSIPSIRATGFIFETLTKTKLYAESVSLNMKLEAYRDKRMPFLKKKETLLPVEFIHRLKFLLQIDTLHMLSSYVEYQEVSEKGTQPGRVFFNELTANIYNLSNNTNDHIIVEARANFMDAGILKATFTFPSTPNKLYHVKGEILNFPLPKINPMLKPIASAQIDEGELVEMKFNFNYNNDHSNGEILIDYTGLKMSSIKRETKKERKFASLLLNTFLRNNMDDNVSKSKKTGTILFYRDKKKSIFNYWWKSLLSGIKSVYNLDKIMDTDGKKN